MQWRATRFTASVGDEVVPFLPPVFITGKVETYLTQIVKATGDNKQALINVKPEELDTVNGFGFVRLSLTVGVAASLASAQVLGVNPRFAPADASNQAAVVQIL